MSYLLYMCLFVESGVQHILCCVFAFGFLHIVYRMLPVSLDCLFLVFSRVYNNMKFFLLQQVIDFTYDLFDMAA